MTSSDKLKVLLENKKIKCSNKIKKLKKKIKIIKIISVTISLSSIFILSTMASTIILSPIAISILSIISATLIGIYFKFKFHNKAFEKKQLVDKLNKIQIKLEYM